MNFEQFLGLLKFKQLTLTGVFNLKTKIAFYLLTRIIFSFSLTMGIFCHILMKRKLPTFLYTNFVFILWLGNES